MIAKGKNKTPELGRKGQSKSLMRDFPGGPLVKNSPCNVSSIPGQGTKIAHGMEQLSLSAETIEPEWHNQSPSTAMKIPHATTKI